MSGGSRILSSTWSRQAFKALCLLVLIQLPLSAQVSNTGRTQRTAALSPSESALIESSKAAIISTGISPAYFDSHFKLDRVIDKPGDRRVIWNYVIGEYRTVIDDAVGFYADEKGKRLNVHSVRDKLGASHEITRTIKRKDAERLMRRCIGKYTTTTVVYESFGVGRRAALLMIASSVLTEPKSAREKREEEERRRRREDEERREAGRRQEAVDSTGEEESEGDEPVIITGYIDLETGVCTKGVAQVEHPAPPRK